MENYIQFEEFSFIKNELKVNKYWKEEEIYRKREELNCQNPLFRFMDGPPFVSSKNLHYGHILIGYFKDTVLRFKSMHGYRVLNKLGYDCHGLPLEMVVNELLGISTREDVEKYGIEEYNAKCKQIIESYSGAWQPIYTRIGRWADYENEYKTLDKSFMESVWWVFKQLWEKGLIYRGYRVMAYSTACSTPLSNFEANGTENYKEIIDPSVYVKFNLKNEPNTSFIAWTTTPWTLPSNLALCVNKEMTYIKMRDMKSGEIWIVAKECIGNIYPIPKRKKKTWNVPYEVIEEMKGEELEEIEYEPPFNYYMDPYEGFKPRYHEYKVITDDYVTATRGTGIVHTAPAFGEEDYNVLLKNGVVTVKDVGLYCPVDENGCFTMPIHDLVGVYVRDANDVLINKLKESRKLVRKEMYRHNYPFCWRTDTPLIYKAVSSFFVEVTALKDKLLENNKKVNWTPEHIGRGRFNKWLENVKDWGVSRSRFFGTPIPVWISEDGEEMECIGSIEELTKSANLPEEPDDIHLEDVSEIKMESKQGKGKLHHVREILDCWFESGCVPYGQIHYPFENEELLNDEYLSDFICEATDQTRGWFYTLLVLSTALFDKPAYKNVVCSGLVMAEDGKKMSKRLQNYTPVTEILNEYGADALRLYLISSPAARAEPFSFTKGDVTAIIKKMIQWYNCVKFFLEHTIKYNTDGNRVDMSKWKETTNIMDRWIIARVGSMIRVIEMKMKENDMCHMKDIIMNFIEDITNWYIKFNRNRLRGRYCTKEEQGAALAVLYKVLMGLTKIAAPFVPFFCETIYRKLEVEDVKESVHLCTYPTIEEYKVNEEIEHKMRRIQLVSRLVRSLRTRTKESKSAKMPLNKVIVCYDEVTNINEEDEDNKELERYMKEEINAITVEYRTQEGLVNYKIISNDKALGRKYRSLANKIKSEIRKIESTDIKKHIEAKMPFRVQTERKEYILEEGEYKIDIELGELDKKLGEEHIGIIEKGVLVIIDCRITREVRELYIRKLFIRQVQELRKQTLLHPWNKIKIFYRASDVELLEVLEKYRDTIVEDLIYEIYDYTMMTTEKELVSKLCYVENMKVKIVLTDQ